MALRHAYLGASSTLTSDSRAEAIIGIKVFGTTGTGSASLAIDSVSTPVTTVPASPQPQDWIILNPDVPLAGLGCGVFTLTIASANVLLWYRPKQT
jgi:hypothetical protein